MQHFKSWMMGLAILCVSLNAHADLIDEWSFRPFVGVDGGVKHQNFEPEFGKTVFRHNYPLVNFYIGSIFYKYLGFEAGYEYAFRENRNSYFYPQQSTLGYMSQTEVSRLYFSNAYFNGWHIDLLGFWPIFPKAKTELTGSIGLAWLKAHYQTTFAADITANAPNTIATPAWWESDSQTVLRVGLGIKQMISRNFGVRGQVLWENTSKLGATIPVPTLQTMGGPQGVYTVRPENSYLATLGLFLQLDGTD